MSFERYLPKLAAVAAGALFLLGGCGYQPIYGRSAGAANEVLARTEIAPIGDWTGQMLRNDLIDRFYFDGRPARPDYRLHVDLTSTVSNVGLLKNATSALREVRMVATYQITDPSGRVIGRGSARAINSFPIAESEYMTLLVERDAMSRAVEEVANELTRRTAVTLADFESDKGSGSGTAGAGPRSDRDRV